MNTTLNTETRTSERVHLMKKNFMRLHNDGYNIQEIAEMFFLTPSTVYKHLGEIAKENEVTRDSLLQEVHKTPGYWNNQSRQLHVDLSNLLNNFDSAINALTDTIDGVSEIIENMEKMEVMA